jgi:hypothetical protein
MRKAANAHGGKHDQITEIYTNPNHASFFDQTLVFFYTFTLEASREELAAEAEQKK